MRCCSFWLPTPVSSLLVSYGAASCSQAAMHKRHTCLSTATEVIKNSAPCGCRARAGGPVVCSSSWYEGPSTSQPSGKGPERPGGRGPRGVVGGGRRASAGRGRSRPPAPFLDRPAAPPRPGLGQGRFQSLYAQLCEGQQQGFVIKKEAWEKLFSAIGSKADADLVMALMLSDARVRDETKWDWVTHGHGQTITQLVKAAAAVEAYNVCDWALENAGLLRLTIGNDTIPNFMRKMAAAGADVAEVERLYRLEEKVRGSNTNAGFYELLRVYKRAGSVARVQALLTEATSKQVALKEGMVEEVQTWLQKRA